MDAWVVSGPTPPHGAVNAMEYRLAESVKTDACPVTTEDSVGWKENLTRAADRGAPASFTTFPEKWKVRERAGAVGWAGASGERSAAHAAAMRQSTGIAISARKTPAVGVAACDLRCSCASRW